MTKGTDDLKNAWRDSAIPGVPDSGEHEPDKREIRLALDSLSLDIIAAGSGGDPEAVRDVIEPILEDAEAAADLAASGAAAAVAASQLLYNYATLYAGRGASDPITGSTGSDGTVIVNHSTINPKTLTAFRLWAVGAGTLSFARYTRSGSGPTYAWAKVANVGAPVVIGGAGLSAVLTAADFGAVNLQPGEYLGWYFSGRFAITGNADTPGFALLGPGLPTSGNAAISTGGTRIEYSATFADQSLAFHADKYVDIESSKSPKKWSQEIVSTLLGRSANLAVTKTPGAFVNINTGAVTANANYAVFSGPVRGGSTLRANRKSGSGTAGYVFRDIDGNAILPGALYVTANTDIAVPANAATIDFSVDAQASYPEAGPVMNPEYALVIWDTAYGNPADYVSQGMIGEYAAHKRANRVARAHKPPKWDYYDPDDVTQGMLRNYLGNLQANAGFDVVRVPCEYGTPIYVSHTMTGVTNTQFGPMWYDRDGNKVAYSGASVTANFDGTTTMVVTAQSATFGRITRGMALTDTTGSLIPAGTYVVDGPLDGGPGSYTLSQAATGTAAGSTVEARVYAQNAPLYPPKGACFVDINYNIGNRGRLSISTAAFGGPSDQRNCIGWADIRRRLPWRSKQIAVLGDSIAYSINTLDNRFALNIERGLRAYAAQVSPVPGRTMAQILDATGGTYPATRGSSAALTSADFAAIDLAIIHAMTNDWGSNLPLGNLGDTTAATFHGSMYDICVSKLQTWRPAMRLALCTAPRRFDRTSGGDFANGNPTNGNGAKLSDFADAVIAFCRYYGFICIDFFHEGAGVNALNKAAYLGDNLHPNAAGYSRMETFTVSQINRAGC